MITLGSESVKEDWENVFFFNLGMKRLKGWDNVLFELRIETVKLLACDRQTVYLYLGIK